MAALHQAQATPQSPASSGGDVLADQDTPSAEPQGAATAAPLAEGAAGGRAASDGDAGPHGSQALPPWPEDAPPLERALVAGSWGVDAEHPFELARIDEEGLRVAYTRRRAGRRIWQGLRGDSDYVPVDVYVRDREGPLFAYAYALVQRGAPEPFAPGAFPEQPAVLHVRHHGRARVWFDGELVLDLQAPPPGRVGEAAAAVRLTDAFDVILAKLGRGSEDLGTSLDLELRLSLPDGTPVPDQGFNTMRPSHLPPDVPAELLR